MASTAACKKYKSSKISIRTVPRAWHFGWHTTPYSGAGDTVVHGLNHIFPRYSSTNVKQWTKCYTANIQGVRVPATNRRGRIVTLKISQGEGSLNSSKHINLKEFCRREKIPRRLNCTGLTTCQDCGGVSSADRAL